MTKATSIQICAPDANIYLVKNTGKPWWKKKDFMIIPIGKFITIDLEPNSLEIEKLYIRMDGELYPITSYPYAKFIV